MGKQDFYSLDGPLDSIPIEGQMRSANLTQFAALVQKAGGDARDLLERHDIDPWLIRDPDHYIDCQSLVDLFEDCGSTFNDPLFGLKLAQIQEPEVYGCITALCRAAPNIRESINSFIDFLPVAHSPSSLLELVEGEETTELRWWAPSNISSNDQANYQGALLNLKLLQQIAGRDFRPSYVNLAVDARNRDFSELEQRLGCRFHKTGTDNAIAFPSEILNQPVPSANRLLYKLLGGYLGKVKAASRKTTTERVQDYIRGALPSGHCSIERCADKLGMSVRTLQTNLSESGHKFSDILENHRADLARSYLAQEQLSLDDVANNLGYSEQSSFGRAFKRWTGVTPKQFRQQCLAEKN